MTYAAAPALAADPALAARWLPGLASRDYDPGCRPSPHKAGAIAGMGMTEKQGGSDVRANTTRAVAAPGGPLQGGDTYRLTGHKWFCSAPMSDAFLVLAQTDAGLGCFLVPRVLDDGTRNPFALQRLKDKLGNRSQRLLRGRARRHVGRPRRRRGPRHPHHPRHGRRHPARLRARLGGDDARRAGCGRCTTPGTAARSARCSSTSR